jgi:hypothetical protein
MAYRRDCSPGVRWREIDVEWRRNGGEDSRMRNALLPRHMHVGGGARNIRVPRNAMIIASETFLTSRGNLIDRRPSTIYYKRGKLIRGKLARRALIHYSNSFQTYQAALRNGSTLKGLSALASRRYPV